MPAIVELDTWTRSQTIHQRNTHFSPRHVGTERYLLRYLVRYAECGQARASGGKVQTNGADIAQAVEERFGIRLHRRTVERH